MTDFIKNLHFLVIHFPMALIILSFALDLIAAFCKKSKWFKPLQTAGFIVFVIGALSAMVTVAAGFIAFNFLPAKEQLTVISHATKNTCITLYWILLAGIRMYFRWNKQKEIGQNPIFLILAFIIVILDFYVFKITRFSHFFFIQFTVPVISLVLLADIATFFGKDKSWKKPTEAIGFYLFILGTVSIILTAAFGMERSTQHVPGRPFDYAAIQTHEVWGIATTVFFILLSLFRSFFYFKGRATGEIKAKVPYFVLLIIGYGLLAITSHLGGYIHLFKSVWG